jgi:hypothetical protein
LRRTATKNVGASGDQEARGHLQRTDRNRHDRTNGGLLVTIGLPPETRRDRSGSEKNEVSNEGGIVRFSLGSSDRRDARAR